MLLLLSILSLAQSEYEINYEKTDYPGINTPKCGPEIELVNVTEQHSPSQIRLSYTTDCTEMAIMWTTSNVDHINVVNYGLLQTALNYSAIAISHQYTWYDGYVSGYIHEALLLNLEPGMKHYYQIVSNDKQSDVISFTAAPRPGATDVPVSFFHTGDVGIFGTSVMVTSNMLKSMKNKTFHGMIHCGDIAYSNKYNGSKPKWAKQEIWDTWGEMVEPLAKTVPYMVAPGNHEMDFPDSTGENITIYTKRFIMPGNERYFSFSVGMVHFVAINTDESIGVGTTQGKWFENKLKYINENRNLWPWLVVFQHRPIYNSNRNHGYWNGTNGWETDWWTYPEKNGWLNHFEDLIVKYDVDFVLTGHVHQYERSWPVKNRSNQTVYDTYNNAPAPVHITCGHGGKDLYKWEWDTNSTVDTFTDVKPAWSAVRNNVDWGHCEIEFKDRDTAEHLMYKMGETEPSERVTIVRNHPISGATRLRSVTLVSLIVVWYTL